MIPPTARSLLGAIAAQAGALALAFAGGAAFAWLDIPAAWLSGAMIVTAIPASMGLLPPMPAPLRDFSMLVAGISLGLGITPEALTAISAYPLSLTLLFVGILAIMASSTFVLRRFNGWPLRDAFFASAPGSLNAVLIIAAEVRADVSRIAVVQACRLFFLVMVLPSVITAVEPGEAATLPAGQDISPASLALLFAAALLAKPLFDRMRVAASLIMGAMVSSALLTGSSVVVGHMPAAITIVGFVVIGAFIGQRFRGMELTMLVRLFPAIVTSLLSTLLIAAAFAVLVSLATSVPIGEASVAFAPGGLEAMTVLALALGLDPLYVSVHHTCRFVLVGLIVPLALKFWPALSEKGRPAP